MSQAVKSEVILLVDDDEPGRYAHARILRRAGYEVREAATGTQALELLSQDRPDLAILDIRLPGASGSEVLRQIRANPATAALPTMYLSATFADEESIAHGLAEGADAYLTKPVAPAVLLGQVTALLRVGRMNRALRESEARLSQIVSSIQDGFFELDRQWRFTYINPRAARNGGFEPEQLLGRSLWEALPYLAGSEFETVYREVMETRRARQFEVKSVIRDQWYLINVYPSVVGISGFWTDVTARVQAEEALRQTDAELKEAQRLARVGSWHWNTETDLVTVSEQVYHMLGLDPALPIPVMREREWELYTPETQQRVRDAVQRAVRTGEGYTMEVEARRADGSPLWISVRAEAVRGADGRIVGLRGTDQDITERKLAEEARQESDELLRAVVDGIPDPVYIKDHESRIVMANPALAEVAGRPLEEIIGRTDTEYYGDAAAGRQLREHDLAVMASGGSTAVEETVPTPRGPRTFLSTKAARRDAQGQVVGIIGVSHDITHRKQAEERALAAERARAAIAEHMNDEIDHRVKNNLAMVSGLLQVQLLREQDPHVAAALRDAIGRIRTFVTLHGQMYASRAEEADLFVALQQIAATMRELFAARGDVAISVCGDSFPCSARVATNLSVAANELVTNALKYGGPGADGRRAVDVRLRPAEDTVTLSVWSSGNPVPDDIDPTQSRTLGLRLVHDMVVGRYEGRFRLCPSDGGTLAELTVPGEAIRADSVPR